MTGRIQKLQLTGIQEGLMLTITPEDYLVHWSGIGPQNNNTRLVEEDITLPYQEGSVLRDTNTPTEVVSSTTQDLIDFRVTSYQQVLRLLGGRTWIKLRVCLASPSCLELVHLSADNLLP
jgi:hypothetical protein